MNQNQFLIILLLFDGAVSVKFVANNWDGEHFYTFMPEYVLTNRNKVDY
jgi:hypothetical protein